MEALRQQHGQHLALIVSVVLILLVFIGGCSQKPSNAEAVKAIETKLQNSLPFRWTAATVLGGSRNIEIMTIHIVQRGKMQKSGLTGREFWPVRADIIISAEPRIIGFMARGFEPRRTFEKKNRVFHLFKDDFGKLRAKYVR